MSIPDREIITTSLVDSLINTIAYAKSDHLFIPAHENQASYRAGYEAALAEVIYMIGHQAQKDWARLFQAVKVNKKFDNINW